MDSVRAITEQVITIESTKSGYISAILNPTIPP
uniref:Uncharacterized protein n=1 Tax=Rhizophora mucronata TaxID=61149 RepID=A0A2P2P442_RHIMU